MRTTLTLDEDVCEKLKELAHRRKVSFRRVVNEALRAGLSSANKPGKKPERFRVKASHCGFRPGIDIGKLNQLVDDLDAEDFGHDREHS